MRIGDVVVSGEAPSAICQKWKIGRLEIFSSASTVHTNPSTPKFPDRAS